MDKLRLFVGMSLGLLGLTGCETIVDVDTPPHTPRLALSYTLSNTPAVPSSDNSRQGLYELRRLFVSSSQGVLETKEPTGRGDATVQLFDESGQLVEQFRSKAQRGYYGITQRDSTYGNYVATKGFVGVPGRRYTLRASAPGVTAIEASLTLPAVPTIESASYVARPRDPNGGGPYGYVVYGGRFAVAVADNPATTDYYLAYARVLDKQGNYWGRVSRDYNSGASSEGPDINLGRFQLSEPDSYYSQYPYSDAASSGSRLSFGTDVNLYFQGGYDPTGGGIPEPGYIEVVVSGITPDTYQFYQSALRYFDTDGNIFAEPAPLHSNLRGGYGLFGGATDATYRIKLF